MSSTQSAPPVTPPHAPPPAGWGSYTPPEPAHDRPAPPRRRSTRPSWRSLGRRLLHFWFVWSALLFVHEAGHVVAAQREGLVVRRVTVGAGPVVWRGERSDVELVLRLVPLAGITSFRDPADATRAELPASAHAWGTQALVLAGGMLATLALGVALAVMVGIAERSFRRRWAWGRMLVADAAVLTVFNLFPVPPLDGGRALLTAITTLSGTPLSSEALMWIQAGGLALALVPMALWTGWTARIDRVAMWWGAPAGPGGMPRSSS